jgi:hypothetical protein
LQENEKSRFIEVIYEQMYAFLLDHVIMNPEDQHRSCPGFLDEYGVWNNGFECPIISGQIRVCCGTDFRRYCCSLENSFNNSEKSFLSTNKSIFSFIDQLNLTFLTVPILLTCILIIILLLLFILLSLSIYYHYRKRKKIKQDERSSTKQTIQVDHFPFSPPHRICIQMIGENYLLPLNNQ